MASLWPCMVPHVHIDRTRSLSIACMGLVQRAMSMTCLLLMSFEHPLNRLHARRILEDLFLCISIMTLCFMLTCAIYELCVHLQPHICVTFCLDLVYIYACSSIRNRGNKFKNSKWRSHAKPCLLLALLSLHKNGPCRVSVSPMEKR
jgi:hypothetical protein